MSSFDKDKKPFDQERAPSPDRESRPFSGERKDFGDRESRPFSGERKDFGDRESRPFDRERKEYGDREKRPFSGERKEYGDREKRPFSGERKEYGDREKRPFSGERNEYGDREKRPFSGERKEYGDREKRPFSGERKEYGDREKRPFSGERKDFGDREKRPFDRDQKGPRRPPLREVVMDLDRDILKLLARRCNILDRLRGHRGQLDSREERELRAAWEMSAGKMSRDARLIRQMFSLFQEIEFLARPTAGEERRPAFNLAPVQRPIDLHMTAPLACRRSRLYLTLAAVAGAACRIHPSLLNDQAVECIKMFNQAGTSLAWDDDGTMRAREGGGLTLADKVIYVGEDLLNFYLILGQYVGQMSRAKFTAESALKLADVSAMRRFLPQLGARLSNAVPKSDGLPVRIECSGLLPDSVTIPAELPMDAVVGLLMGAPFWDKAVTFHLDDHPHKDAIIEEAGSVLQACKADMLIQNNSVHIVPCTEDSPLQVPAEPPLGMDITFAANLLALTAGGGGNVHLKGSWPDCTLATQVLGLLRSAGVETKLLATGIQASRTGHGTEGPINASPLPLRFVPLALALAAIPALRGKRGHMPLLPAEADKELVDSFLTHIGLEVDEDGTFVKARKVTPAPAPVVEREEAEGAVAGPEQSPKQSAEQETDLGAVQTTGEASGDSTADSAAPATEKGPEGTERTQEVAAARTAPPAYVSRHPDAHEGVANWTAPTAEWALALSLTAFAHPGLKLANPGIMTTLYPVYWTLYNGLPNPDFKRTVPTEPVDEKPVRRRIIAGHNPAVDAGDSDD